MSSCCVSSRPPPSRSGAPTDPGCLTHPSSAHTLCYLPDRSSLAPAVSKLLSVLLPGYGPALTRHSALPLAAPHPLCPSNLWAGGRPIAANTSEHLAAVGPEVPSGGLSCSSSCATPVLYDGGSVPPPSVDRACTARAHSVWVAWGTLALMAAHPILTDYLSGYRK